MKIHLIFKAKKFGVGSTNRAKRNVYAKGIMDSGMDSDSAYAIATSMTQKGAKPAKKGTKKELKIEIKRQKKEKKQMKKSEMSMGVGVEKEHADTIKFIKDYYRTKGKFPPNKMVYKRIASNHLEEFGKYYTALKEMEDELKADAKKKKKVCSEKVVQFLKDNPNPKDEQVHAFAEKNGYDNHTLEHVIYKLATKHVKQHM